MKKDFKKDATMLSVTHWREGSFIDVLYKEWGIS